MTITAGRLEWDLDVKGAEQVEKRIDNLRQKLDQALRPRSVADSGINRVGQDADGASKRVQALADRFKLLQGQFRTGRTTLDQYRTGLAQLQQGIDRTKNRVDLTAKQWATLGTTMRNVQREQASFAGSTPSVTARVQALVNEVRLLRNNWQETGQATTATKERLFALRVEMGAMSQELRKADGGWEKYNQQIARLAVAGRSAEATVAGMEGRMSRLGLASQVQLGTQQLLTQQLYRFGPAGAVAANSLGIVAGGMATLSASTLGLGAILAVTAAGIGSIHRTGTPQIREFQEALAILRASGEDLSEADLAGELERIRDAAGRAGDLFTRAEMATAMAELVKAGIDANESMRLLAPGMQLAAVTGQSLNDTTSALLANLRQFGLDTRHAQRAADALAAADLAAAHGAAELSEGLATVGPVARAAGLTLEDTLGILVELDNKGLDPADKGATALRGTMSALLDPTKEALGVLDSLGVTLRDGAGNARPLLTVLRELQKALGENEEAAQAAAQIFDTRAITAILNMSDESENLTNSLNDSAGALKAYADEMMRENLAKAEQARVKAWQDLATTMATQTAPALASFNTQLARYFRLLDEASQRPWWKQGNTIGGFLFARDLLFGPQEQEYVEPGQYSFNGKTSLDRFREDANDVAPTMAALIAEAERLKVALEEAGDGQAWVDAQRAIEAFRASSDDAADAWSYVNRTVARTTSTMTRDLPTVKSTFSDLEEAGKAAERTAIAFGDTLEARIESAQTRGRLIGQALNTLLVDFGLDPLSAEVQFLVGRLAQLETEITMLQTRLNPTISPFDRTRMTLAEAGGPSAGMVTGLTSKEIRDALLESPAYKAAQADAAAAWREYARVVRTAAFMADRYGGMELLGPDMSSDLTSADIKQYLKDALQRRLEAYLDLVTSPFRATAMTLAEAGGPSAGMSTGMSLEEVRTALLGSPAHLANVRAAELAWRDYSNAVQGWARFADERLGAEIGGPSMGMSTGMTPAEIREFLEAAVARRWAEFEREMLAPSRINAMNAAEVGGPSAGMATNMSPDEIRAALRGALPTIERYQRQIIDLREKGFEPASTEIQTLVRRINELELKAALTQLREKGVRGLSDFNRQLLIANGILPGATLEVTSFADRLRSLSGATGGNDVADGLADILDGIRMIGEAAGDAEKLVAGLTLALQGGTTLVAALRDGDALGFARGAVGVLGEGVGQLTGIPGLGGLATAAFDFGHQIVMAISDAFTGDSPAARQIREGLTPAIAGAFANGIMQGIRGAEGWQEGLRDGVKAVFLQSLVEAFVQGAIVQTYLAPVIAEYSKLLAAGNVEGAKAYLETSLGPALEQAYQAAEAFVGTIPDWLIPSSSSTGTRGGSTGASTMPSYHSLPEAQLEFGAPTWVMDLTTYFGKFSNSVDKFSAGVDRLVDEGITVNTSESRSRSDPEAAARAA